MWATSMYAEAMPRRASCNTPAARSTSSVRHTNERRLEESLSASGRELTPNARVRKRARSETLEQLSEWTSANSLRPQSARTRGFLVMRTDDALDVSFEIGQTRDARAEHAAPGRSDRHKFLRHAACNRGAGVQSRRAGVSFDNTRSRQPVVEQGHRVEPKPAGAAVAVSPSMTATGRWAMSNGAL